MKFDLTVYAFETHQPRLLCTASAGKGAARGREEDSLIIKLWPSDAVSLSEEVLNQTLSKLAAAFFKTSGSVTNAMRTLADGLNKTFLSGNSQLQERIPGRRHRCSWELSTMRRCLLGSTARRKRCWSGGTVVSIYLTRSLIRGD